MYLYSTYEPVTVYGISCYESIECPISYCLAFAAVCFRQPRGYHHKEVEEKWGVTFSFYVRKAHA